MKDILYRSTRSDAAPITASRAILQGLAPDGGLYVPVQMPALDKSFSVLSRMSYQETAYEVMKLFLTDFSEQELKGCIQNAYDDKFDTEEIVPLVKVGDAWHLELFHGATIAFKDMALSLLPYLMTTAAVKNGEERQIVILTATSGDTGKAALAGFADVPGTKIIVFYPKNGVSAIQEKQMVTQKGDNTLVVGIDGNFDDAQNGVKAIFGDKALEQELSEAGYCFSSANSINIGRLVPQIAYYVYGYARLLARGEIAEGEPVNIVVPTGNFGNILAAFYAGKIGMPIGKLICASNDNKVLYDFFQSGIYDRRREFILTSSPSMDILISSNLERLIFELTGCDAAANQLLMDALKETGVYGLTQEMKAGMDGFAAGFTTEQQTAEAIARTYKSEGYVMDTHTAVAADVYRRYREETGDDAVTLLASTASPYKFTPSVMGAIDDGLRGEDDFFLIERLREVSGTDIPQAIREIMTAPVRHRLVCTGQEMEQVVRDFLR